MPIIQIVGRRFPVHDVEEKRGGCARLMIIFLDRGSEYVSPRTDKMKTSLIYNESRTRE